MKFAISIALLFEDPSIYSEMNNSFVEVLWFNVEAHSCWLNEEELPDWSDAVIFMQ